MMRLLEEGGVPIWFVLLFGLAALGGAVAYALRPQARLLGLIRGMSAATFFGTLSGTAANLGAVFHALAGSDSRFPDLNLFVKDGPLRLLQGLGESMSTSIVGFALLALVGLFYAVGKMREPA